MKIRELLKYIDNEGENIGKEIVSDLRVNETEYIKPNGKVVVSSNRITQEQIEKLLDEEVWWECDGDRFYCYFVEDRKTICEKLNIPMVVKVYQN